MKNDALGTNVANDDRLYCLACGVAVDLHDDDPPMGCGPAVRRAQVRSARNYYGDGFEENVRARLRSEEAQDDDEFRFQQIKGYDFPVWGAQQWLIGYAESLRVRLQGHERGGKCTECDGSGDEMVDSMTLYGVPGGYDVSGPCPECAGTGSAIAQHALSEARGISRAQEEELELVVYQRDELRVRLQQADAENARLIAATDAIHRDALRGWATEVGALGVRLQAAEADLAAIQDAQAMFVDAHGSLLDFSTSAEMVDLDIAIRRAAAAASGTATGSEQDG